MAVYSVEGKLGTGKTKFCVWMAQKALLAGRKVASNVDLNLHELCPGRAVSYQRVPDKPGAVDLFAIGHGNPDSYDEEKNGVLILDELGSWLNTRSFQDKGRAAVIDWFIHARKFGWDVYLIVQDANMIDRQVREALIEYQCRCVRLDKMRIPGIGWLLGLIHPKLAFMPRMHVVSARVGYAPNQMIADRWFFRGDDLHAAYDTRQVFRSDYPHPTREIVYTPEPANVKRSALARLLAGVLDRHAKRGGPAPRPKSRVVALISELPINERIPHVRRLVARGLL